jgi:Trypsin-like peptidase domain
MAIRPSKIKQNFSYVPVQIQMRYGETELSIGTGFFYLFEGESYFVTNWHNVTGRNSSTSKPLSSTGALPDNIVIYAPHYEETQDNKIVAIRWNGKIITLYEDQDKTDTIWLEHPQYQQQVDVVVVQLSGIEETAIKAANDSSLKLDDLDLMPGLDVFILGFPRGLSGGGRFPLWKRGSIASEPDVDIDGLPKLFVDTATREGMSGSPVYARETGMWAPEGKKFPHEAVFGTGYRFIGIYSGRVGDDPFQAQLGIVWKERVIQEIIQGNQKGKSSF